MGQMQTGAWRLVSGSTTCQAILNQVWEARSGEGDAPRPCNYFVDRQSEQTYFISVLLPGYTAPQCGNKNPRKEKDMQKKKTTAKSKKLHGGKKLEKQKPLLKYNLDNVLRSGQQTSGHGGSSDS
jgi:hypothetical protein